MEPDIKIIPADGPCSKCGRSGYVKIEGQNLCRKHFEHFQLVEDTCPREAAA